MYIYIIYKYLYIFKTVCVCSMIIMGQKYMVYFHTIGTERIWVEHTHRTDGFFFFFHRPPVSWNLYNVETLRIPQHRSRKEACAFKTLEKHDSNTRIKGEKITYPCISIRNSIVEIQVSLMHEKYRTKLRSSM